MTHPLLTNSSGGTPFEDGADHGRVLISGESTSNSYSLMELTVAPQGPDAGFGAHAHRDIEEVFVVRSGILEFLVDQEITPVTAGDVVRVPPGVRHGYRNNSPEAVELLVWFSPGGFEQLFVTYRTNQATPDADGFVKEATERFNSSFEQ